MRFNPSPYSPEMPDLGNYGLTAQRTDVTTVSSVSKGSTGYDVAILHDALINHPSVQAGYFASSSDVKNQKFGSDTEELVRDFQQVAGIGVDGKVGKNTWAALDRPGVHVYEFTSMAPTIAATRHADGTLKVDDSMFKEIKFYQRPWFLPAAIGGGVLIVGVIIVLSRRSS